MLLVVVVMRGGGHMCRVMRISGDVEAILLHLEGGVVTHRVGLLEAGQWRR